MPQPSVKIFRALLVSVSLIGLSACATSPDSTGVDMRSVHDRIENARQRSIVLGTQAWQGARRLISNATRGPDDSLDEVDLALLEKDAVLPPSKFDIKRRDRWASGQQEATRPSEAVQIQAVPRPVAARATELPRESTTRPGNGVMTADVLSDVPAGVAGDNDDAPQRRPIVVAERKSDIIVEDTASDDSAAELIDAAEAPVAESPTAQTPADIIHTVQAGETLWTIAKATTGDANDWHTIADINDLAPDASVRVGQDLRIPGELIDTPAATRARPDAVAAATPDTQPATESEPARTRIATLESTDDAAVLDNVNTIDSTDITARDNTDPAPTTPALAALNPAAEQVFEVDAGETLWDFAKRVTGDATNWATIAAHNAFDQRAASTVREGQSIRVPLDLLDEARPASTRSTAADESAVIEPQAAVKSNTPSTGDAQALKAAAAALSNRPQSAASSTGNQPERIVEARYVEERPNQANTQTTIQVRGTYYPKAVYRKADFSSALLMRVSPGTAMTVARAVGPWYEVETDKGIGYMHSRDIK